MNIGTFSFMCEKLVLSLVSVYFAFGTFHTTQIALDLHKPRRSISPDLLVTSLSPKPQKIGSTTPCHFKIWSSGVWFFN